MPAPSGVCTAGRKRVNLSRLCGGRARAGSVRMPAAFTDGGAWGVAAVCRRPVKAPPRQFGERAFTGFPWVPTWLWGLVGQVPVCTATSGVVYDPAPTALPAASKAQLRRPYPAPQSALASKIVAPATVLTREIAPGRGRRRGLGAQEARCGCPSPRCGPGRSPGSGLR